MDNQTDERRLRFVRRTAGNSVEGSSSGKALGYELYGLVSIPDDGGLVIFLHSFVYRLVLGCTQPPSK